MGEPAGQHDGVEVAQLAVAVPQEAPDAADGRPMASSVCGWQTRGARDALVGGNISSQLYLGPTTSTIAHTELVIDAAEDVLGTWL